MFHLFRTFGNPVAVKRAIEEANPNAEQAEQDRHRLQRIAAELAKVRKGRDQILELISDGNLTKQEAVKKLDELKQRETTLSEESGRLEVSLASILDAQQIKVTAQHVATLFKGQRMGSAKLWAKKASANEDIDKMTWEEKRTLAELVFGGRSSNGERLGIYVERIDGQRTWRYAIHGHLINMWGKAPFMPTDDPEYGFGFGAGGRNRTNCSRNFP